MQLGDLSSWAILIIVVCLLNPAIFAILDFMEVDSSSYDSYIIWGNALLIFWFVLSEKRTSELSKI